MKLYVNEKIFSLHNKFYVKDENDQDVYLISSQVFSIGDKTTITDMQGNRVAYIEQEILHLMPHYNIYFGEEVAFQIKKKFQLFKNDYELTNGYRVEGNVFALDFNIFDDAGNQVGSIKRALISIGDKYEMEIIDPSKLNIVLAIIVAITNDINRSQNTTVNTSE